MNEENISQEMISEEEILSEVSEAATEVEDLEDTSDVEAEFGDIEASDAPAIPDNSDEPDEPDKPDVPDEIETLRAEVAALRGALEAKEREHSRMLGEIGDFSEVFPERTLEEVPTEVSQQVKGGVPLAAAYALYEKRTAAHNKLVEQVNMRNTEQSAGALGGAGDYNYFSPSEVRRMSATEVKANYKMIIESMKKWN